MYRIFSVAENHTGKLLLLYTLHKLQEIVPSEAGNWNSRFDILLSVQQQAGPVITSAIYRQWEQYDKSDELSC
jgi:hypothetical protein